MYTVEWQDYNEQWKGLSDHWFFFIARRKVLKHILKRHHAYGWRILKNDREYMEVTWKEIK